MGASLPAQRFVLALLALAFLTWVTPAGADHPGTRNVEKRKTVRGKVVRYLEHTDSRPALLGGPRSARARRLGAAPSPPASPGGQLAATWCGDETTGENADVHARAPRVKVMYAYPVDQENRFSTYDDTIQSNVKAASDQLAAESGNRKTIRFDVGTSCGSQYVDIRVVRLPQPRSAYYVGGQVDIGRVIGDLPLSSPSGVRRNFAVYLDHLDDPYAAGLGYMPLDDRPGAVNSSNLGGLGAFMLGSSAFTAHVLLHEIGHTLGAVQDTTPHSTQAGHCFDEWDVMCYADGGVGPLTFPCLGPERFDCGGDDYFNPTPSGWLATHWNVYDSDFLCSLPDGCDQRHTVVDLSNGDDRQTVKLNGHVVGTANFAENRTIDLGSLSASDEITIETYNDTGGYSWGFDVRSDGATTAHDVAGSPGTSSGDQRQEQRVVHRVTLNGRGVQTSVWDVSTNERPTAAIAYTPSNPIAGQTIAFRSESSDPDGGEIVGRDWDLDADGEFDDATGVGAVRAYPVGTWTVRFRATDEDGGAAVAERSVPVIPSPYGNDPRGPDASPDCATAKRRRDSLARSIRAIKRRLRGRLSGTRRRRYQRRLATTRARYRRAVSEVRRLC